MTKQLPIGVFDSGMGGLTVLKQLIADFPKESFLYLGDTARLPYGTKSPETVARYALQIAQLLMDRGIKMLVVACNTATTSALPALKKAFPDLPIIGVVEPGVEAALLASRQKHIAVLATETTLASGIYQATLHERDATATVITQACPLFVSLAEEGVVTGAIANAVVAHYLNPLLQAAPLCDCIILGCTHFPVLAEAITAQLPKHIMLINSAAVTSHYVGIVLRQHGLATTLSASRIHFLVTDQVARFIRVGKLFFGQAIAVHQVELTDLT